MIGEGKKVIGDWIINWGEKLGREMSMGVLG